MLAGQSAVREVILEAPKYIEPFLDGTPLAIERIKCAWPTLSIADKSYLLLVLLADRVNDPRGLRWQHHRNQVLDFALADEIAIVRYLAARHITKPLNLDENEESSLDKQEKARYELVKTDSFPLVRHANVEQGWKRWGNLDNSAAYWAKPHIERLALINGVKERGKEVADILCYAAKNLLLSSEVTINELLDVLLQYLGGETLSERVAESKEYSRRFYDGWAEYETGESIEALWNAIPDLPAPLRYALLESLPEKAGLKSNIPPHVLNALTANELAHLLYRNDITLQDLRQKLFRESANDTLRDAAIHSERFELQDSDISKLVYDLDEPEESGRKKVDELARLAMSCKGASLVQMQAICDLISDAPSNFHSGLGKWDSIGFGQMQQTKRAQKLSSTALEYEVFGLRLFELAKNFAPIKGNRTPIELPEKMLGHKGLIVPKNPWQTYINLAKVVKKDRWRTKLDYLPDIYIKDFDIPGEYLGDSADYLGPINLLRDVEERVGSVADKDKAELAAMSAALSSLSIKLQSIEENADQRLSTIHSLVGGMRTTLTVIAVVVAAILVRALSL